MSTFVTAVFAVIFTLIAIGQFIWSIVAAYRGLTWFLTNFDDLLYIWTRNWRFQRRFLWHIVSEQKSSLPLQVQQCVDDLLKHIDHIEDNITEYDWILSRSAKIDHRSQRLMELKGIGPQPPVHWSPVSVMLMILRMGVSLQPGWD